MDEDNKRDAIENVNEELAAALEDADDTTRSDKMPETTNGSAVTDSSAISEELDKPIDQPDQDIEMAVEKFDPVEESVELNSEQEPKPSDAPFAMNEAVVESEIEPSTIATTVGSEPVIRSSTKSPQAAGATEPLVTPVAAPATVNKKPASNKRLMMFLIGSLFLILVAGALTWMLLAGNEENNTVHQETSSQGAADQILQANVVTASVAEGVVEYQRGEGVDWQSVSSTASTTLEEGDVVRTGDDSRAELVFDDGGAIRLDANTTVRLTRLAVGQAEIEQVEGVLYSRATPAGGSLVINIDDASYRAIDAAFGTIKSPVTSGVQVYYGSVAANEAAETLVQGQQHYSLYENADLQGVVTAVDVSSLIAGEEFIHWNVEQDKLNPAFVGNLGILAQHEHDEDGNQPNQSESTTPIE